MDLPERRHLNVRPETADSNIEDVYRQLAHEMAVSDALMTENIALRRLLDDCGKGMTSESLSNQHSNGQRCKDLEKQITELRDINREAQENLEDALDSIKQAKGLENECRKLKTENEQQKKELEQKIEGMRRDFVTTLNSERAKWNVAKQSSEEESFFKTKDLIDEVESLKSENSKLKTANTDSIQNISADSGRLSLVTLLRIIEDIRGLAEKVCGKTFPAENNKSPSMLQAYHSSLSLSISTAVNSKDDLIKKLRKEAGKKPEIQSNEQEINDLTDKCIFEASMKEAYKEVIEKVKTWSDNRDLTEVIDTYTSCCEEVVSMQLEASRIRRKLGQLMNMEDSRDDIELTKDTLIQVGQKSSELYQVKLEVELRLESILDGSIYSSSKRSIIQSKQHIQHQKPNSMRSSVVVSQKESTFNHYDNQQHYKPPQNNTYRPPSRHSQIGDELTDRHPLSTAVSHDLQTNQVENQARMAALKSRLNAVKNLVND